MRKMFFIAVLAAATLPAADAPSGVVFVDHGKASPAIAKGEVVVSQSDLIVMGGHRVGPGEVEVHEKQTDVLYIFDGEATVVTGGTMIGGKQTAAGQLRGTAIQGGETRNVTKGDVMVIPAGTPHWFTQVSPEINYLVVKVVKP